MKAPIVQMRLRLAVKAPIVLFHIHRNGKGGWHLDQRRAVRAAKLQNQHLHAAVLRQPVGENAAGRARADNDVVESRLAAFSQKILRAKPVACSCRDGRRRSGRRGRGARPSWTKQDYGNFINWPIIAEAREGAHKGRTPLAMSAAARDGAAQEETSVRRIVLASLVGTTIEFYDFYIYGTAAALVIGQTFFPDSAPQSQALKAFLTFGIAFLARPVGSVLFGHFGDRIGRKSTLVASMLTMGLSTTLIGLLPGYAQAGVVAPWLLCLLRFGQGVGLGGEWGGAALLATENAPRGRRAWFGMFPQLGPPLGFFLANGLFLLLLLGLGKASFVAWAWRIPFLASAVLVAIGLYVRVTLSETPAFQQAMARQERAKVPLLDVVRRHPVALLQGALAIVVCYALFYISTVFALSYGVNQDRKSVV